MTTEADPRGYHHGNLREALVRGALDMIASRGLAGLAVAEIARSLGVSAAAPYRHFRDRNALIAEVARRGFDQLAIALERARTEGRPDAVTALERCGRAHLAFAAREPAAYSAMFGGGVEADPAVETASDAAFAVLRKGAEAACATAAGSRPPALMVALHVWSLTHGVAALFLGPNRRMLPMPAADLLEAGLLLYLQSLGIARAARKAAP